MRAEARATSATVSAVSLAGEVLDSAGRPLPLVRVTLIESGRTTTTREDGSYRLQGVGTGRHTVSFARIGLAPVVRRVVIADADARLDVVMLPSRVELPAVQATASTAATSAFSSPQPLTVMEGTALRASQGTSVGETLEGIPGVRSLSMTTGIGKPVIRGLSSNRVLVLDDGQRLETQQWGSDHAPNVETLGASRIEVLRGPASVLYGSDALGGVINIVRSAPPDAIGIPAFVRARTAMSFRSNPRSPEGTLFLEGAHGSFGARGSITARRAGDMRTPTGLLANTENRTLNRELAVGVRGPSGSIAISYAGRDERIEIYEDPLQYPGFSGFQNIREDRSTLKLAVPFGSSRLEGSWTWERNRRNEYSDERATHVALGLLARTTTAQVNLHHELAGNLTGTIGVFALAQDFEKFGLETLIPSNGARNFGLFVFEQAELGRLKLSLGTRYDFRDLSADSDSVLRLAAQTRRWNAVTGSAGALYQLSEPLAIVANVGRGFRTPSAADLFSHGYHEGTRAFERGNPDLRVEHSLNLDLALRAQLPYLTGEVGAFVNSIRDYIYLRPAGTLDTLDHAQGDAQLRGFELSANYHPFRHVAFLASADYTRGQNTSLGIPLTFVPPARASLGLRIQPPAPARIQSPYLSITAELNAPQRRLDPADVGTAGYTLVHLGAGVSVTGQARVVALDFGVRNLFDTAYRDFMSQYKTIAHAPGRSIVLRTSVEF